jgi:hypothetical protein
VVERAPGKVSRRSTFDGLESWARFYSIQIQMHWTGFNQAYRGYLCCCRPSYLFICSLDVSYNYDIPLVSTFLDLDLRIPPFFIEYNLGHLPWSAAGRYISSPGHLHGTGHRPEQAK